MTSPARPLLALALAAASITFATSQEKSDIPLASAVLIEKFDNYSEKLRSKAESEIGKKRAEVSAILQKHLREHTQDGDLDGAIAIRTVLEKWRKESEDLAASDNPTTPSSTNGWKPLILDGDDPLKEWNYKKGEQVSVEEGNLKINTIGKSYQPIYRSTERDHAVLAMQIEVAHDPDIEKEQQAGIGFALFSKKDGQELGSISCVIQGPEANLLYGKLGDEEGKILAHEKIDVGIGRLSDIQIAFVDGHFLVFSRKRKIHDFHQPDLEDAVVGTAILFGNNSRAEFRNIRLLTPDGEQAKRLLSGKPVE
ncbi:MAG: hypothetical protein ACI9UA_001191 [Pseudoalteromonas tetraodonis]|jgi:hypothetical protein